MTRSRNCEFFFKLNTKLRAFSVYVCLTPLEKVLIAVSTSPARERQSCLTADSLRSLESSDLERRKMEWSFLQMLRRRGGRPCHSVSGLGSEDPELGSLLSCALDFDAAFPLPLAELALLLLPAVEAGFASPLAFLATPFHFFTRALAVVDTFSSS